MELASAEGYRCLIGTDILFGKPLLKREPVDLMRSVAG
jgi:hypothetical protein